MLYIKKLQEENMLKEFRLINVLELEEIPAAITSIPTIVVKNVNVPLSGINAFTWLDNSKYFYQKTNNINNSTKHITIKQDNSMDNDSNKFKRDDVYANLKDEDDDKITIIKFNGAMQNTRITNADNIKQTINDQKINSDIQSQRLNELERMRKIQMAHFLKAKSNENVSNI
jgi:hypothetical protein